MALVSQDPILFNSSVIENIAFGDEQPDLNRVIEAAKIANMTAIGIGDKEILCEADFVFKDFTEISENNFDQP